MKAVEFIKEFGWYEAIVCLPYCSVREGFIYYKNIPVVYDDLKRYVDAWELVQSYGGLTMAKIELSKQSILRWVNPKTELLREAIALVDEVENANN